jgi:hypothetical protein
VKEQHNNPGASEGGHDNMAKFGFRNWVYVIDPAK